MAEDIGLQHMALSLHTPATTESQKKPLLRIDEMCHPATDRLLLPFSIFTLAEGTVANVEQSATPDGSTCRTLTPLLYVQSDPHRLFTHE